MTLSLPIDVLTVLTALHAAGFQAYVVGGAVRDILLSHPEPTDWDFTTDATPEQILELFHESFYENDFGTVAVARKHVREQFNLAPLENEVDDEKAHYSHVIDLDEATKIHESLAGHQVNGQTGKQTSRMSGSREAGNREKMENEVPTSYILPPTSETKSVFEITTFRSDGSYSDFRRPDSVAWGKTIEEDLRRRDFTINAIAIKLSPTFLSSIPDLQNTGTLQSLSLTDEDYELIDPHDGQSDLSARLIRTVGDADDRFQEDALRMLRAIRFCVQLEFSLGTTLLEVIAHHSQLLAHVSWERKSEELLKMLASDHPKLAIELLDETRLLEHLIPELLAAKGVTQGGHHVSDVWTHSLDALEHCPSRDPIVRLATLLHDVAKPKTRRGSGRAVTFYNHEVIGARMARQIAERLKLSRKNIERIFLLVRHHMFYYQPENTDAAIRRFMRKVGLENINDIIDLRIGDRLGSGSRETSWRLEEMKQRMQEQLHQPFSVHDLALSGDDLISECGMTPGPQIGKILHTLFEEVMEDPEKNRKDILLERAKSILSLWHADHSPSSNAKTTDKIANNPPD